MSKNDFNFTKWLTKNDISKILNTVGIELIENNYDRNGKLIRPISKIKIDDKYEYIVRCKFNEEKLAEMEKGKIKNNFVPDSIKTTLLALGSILAASSLSGSSYNSINGNDFVLKFEDFFCYEVLSTKSEEDEIKFGRMLTKNYQEYMIKKFGNFYKAKRNSYYKKLNKMEKEQQNLEEESKSSN